MIKTVKKLTTITDKFPLPVDLFELYPPMVDDNHKLSANYLLGGFYNKGRYPMLALFVSDKEGNILDNKAFILEEGIPTYEELFKNLGYTLI